MLLLQLATQSSLQLLLLASGDVTADAGAGALLTLLLLLQSPPLPLLWMRQVLLAVPCFNYCFYGCFCC